jgi:hypothetical protein
MFHFWKNSSSETDTFGNDKRKSIIGSKKGGGNDMSS